MSIQRAIIIASIILGSSHIVNGYLIDFDTILKCTESGTTCTLYVESGRAK